jgi:hypothetical protein
MDERVLNPGGEKNKMSKGPVRVSAGRTADIVAAKPSIDAVYL